MPGDHSFVLMPAPSQFGVLGFLIILLLLIHILFAGLMMGGGVLSVFFNILGHIDKRSRFRRFSREIIRYSGSTPGAIFLMGFLPLVSLMMLYARVMYLSGLDIFHFFAFIIVHSTAGMLLIYNYKKGVIRDDEVRVVRTGLCLLGILSMMGAYFVFAASRILFATPEVWELFRTPVPMLFSAAVAARFNLFLTVSATVTGTGILLYFFRWLPPMESDADYRKFALRAGVGISITGVIGIPVSLLWLLTTLPDFSLSPELIFINVLILVVLMIYTLQITGMLTSIRPKLNNGPIAMLLLAAILIFTADGMIRETSLQEMRAVVIRQGERMLAEQAEKRGIGAAAEATAAKGEEIFQNRCTMCHAFDTRVVGPPYMETVPQYAGDVESLTEYILNPVKKNPDYPAMPDLGLKTVEAESAAIYLLEEYEKRK